MKTRTLAHFLGCLILALSGNALAQMTKQQVNYIAVASANNLYNITQDPNKLVLLSALDFERLRINLPDIYNKVYAQTGITITLHSTFAEEIPPLIQFMQTTKQPPHAVIFAQDQLYRFTEHLQDLTPLQQVGRNLAISADKTYLQLNQGFFLGLYFNKKLAANTITDFTEFTPQSLAVNFGTAFTTQLFWHYSDFITADGATSADNVEMKLSNALFTYQTLLTEGTIPDSCLTNACINELFINQNIPFAIDGTWMHETFADALGDNLGFAALPTLNTKPSLSLRIPHVLGVLNNLTQQQTRALAMFSRLLIAASDKFQNSLFANINTDIKLDSISYIAQDYSVIGCLFAKMNPHMAHLNMLSTHKEISEFVSTLQVGECYE